MLPASDHCNIYMAGVSVELFKKVVKSVNQYNTFYIVIRQ